MNNSLVTQEVVVHVSGTSIQSKEDALNTAFRNIRGEIAKKVEGYIISAIPKAVEVEKMETQEYTQRFLFLFMPKKKEKVVLQLAVTVEVSTLDI